MEDKSSHNCWSCSPLRDSDLSLSTGIVENIPCFSEYSGISLYIDGSENSKYVLMVYNWCRRRGLRNLDVHHVQEGLLLKTPEKEVKGANTIVCYLSRLTSPSISTQLLGETIETQAEVAQYLSLRNTPNTGKFLSFSRLDFLNILLGPKAVIVGTGTKITVADLGTFSGIHDMVAALIPEDRVKLPNLMRWFDYIQMKGDEDGVYERVPVDKPKFSPPVLEPKVLPKEGAEKGGKKVTPVAPENAPSVSKEECEVPISNRVTPSPPPPSSTASPSPPPPVAEGKQEGEGEGERERERESGKEGKKDKEKKEKKEKPPAQKKEVDSSVSVLNIRVGEITKVWKHPGADALYVEEIDIGEGSVRQVVSGLAKFLTEEEMLGRRVLVLANVKAGKVRDVVSSGLVLCASNEDHSVCQPVSPPPSSSIGERITFEGHEGQPEEVLNPKKKQFEKIQPDLKTDENGIAKFQGIPFMTKAGPCTSTVFNAVIK